MIEYRKLYNDTVVTFHQGIKDAAGKPSETRLDRANCLDAIKNVKAERDSYATQEAYVRYLNVYINAARFMGWTDEQPLV